MDGPTSLAAIRAERIAVRIQNHPSRSDLIPRLFERLAGFEDVEVVPDPQVPWKYPATWRVHSACLERLPEDATHLLVLQDDAVPVPDFHSLLLKAVDEHPNSVILPFVPGFNLHLKEFADARRAGSTHFRFIPRAYVPAVAILYPRSVAEDLLAWSRQGPRPIRGADDSILARYCQKRRVFPVALVPCICDHDAAVLTIGKRHQRRGRHRRAVML